MFSPIPIERTVTKPVTNGNKLYSFFRYFKLCKNVNTKKLPYEIKSTIPLKCFTSRITSKATFALKLGEYFLRIFPIMEPLFDLTCILAYYPNFRVHYRKKVRNLRSASERSNGTCKRSALDILESPRIYGLAMASIEVTMACITTLLKSIMRFIIRVPLILETSKNRR